MSEPIAVTPSTKLSLFAAGSMLFALAGSIPISWLALTSSVDLVNAVGLLLVPASVAVWIAITVRALHHVSLRFWALKCTYIPLGGGVIAALILFLGSLPLIFNMHNPNAHISSTFVTAAALVVAVSAIWCAFSNWQATKDVYLSASLTVLQVVLGTSVVAVVLFFWLGRSPRDDHREG